MEAIEESVPTHPLTHLMSVREKGLEIIEKNIPPDASTVGKAIKDLPLPKNTTLILIIGREKNPQIPAPDTVLEGEQRIIAVTPSESEDLLRTTLRGS